MIDLVLLKSAVTYPLIISSSFFTTAPCCLTDRLHLYSLNYQECWSTLHVLPAHRSQTCCAVQILTKIEPIACCCFTDFTDSGLIISVWSCCSLSRWITSKDTDHTTLQLAWVTHQLTFLTQTMRRKRRLVLFNLGELWDSQSCHWQI